MNKVFLYYYSTDTAMSISLVNHNNYNVFYIIALDGGGVEFSVSKLWA